MDKLIRHFGITGYAVKTSIEVGGVALPLGATQAALSRYARQIVVHTGDDRFPYQLLGSGTAIVVDGRHFIFCCGHQIVGRDLESVSVVSPVSEHMISGRSFHQIVANDDNSDADVRDVRAMRFVPSDYMGGDISPYFFRLDVNRVWPYKSSQSFVLFGYPSKEQMVDYEIPHIGSTRVTLSAEYIGPSRSPHLHSMKLGKTDDFDPDGLSGGPVFYLGGDPGECFFGLAGMMMRGSKQSDTGWFIDAQFLYRMTLGAIDT